MHSSTRGVFWDVKPIKSIAHTSSLARSETTKEFPWHTDCCYASEPPRFFALHVLQADRYGGGTLSILQLCKVLKRLSPETIEVLRSSEYQIDVPSEFFSGTSSIKGSILSADRMDARHRIRFRADILQPLTQQAEKALLELNQVLAEARNDQACLHLDPSLIPNGTIVLMDNGIWLHARNEVKDPERHLRRIRWDSREF